MKQICTGLQFPEGPIAMSDGSIILVEIKRQTLSRVTPEGVIDVIVHCGGGPNGAALGPDGRVYICNNGGFEWDVIDGFTRPTVGARDYKTGSIQVVDLDTGTVETLYTDCNGESLKGPNDIVFDQYGGFYFTDLGKRWARTMDRGSLFYAKADGSSIKEIVHPIETPNGIGLSPDGLILYAAETLAGKIRYWHIESPGILQKTADPFHVGNVLYSFPGIERLDSLAVDSEGNVVVATLATGCVTAVSSEGQVRAVLPVPEYDPMVTNVCFGGEDLRTAYITSSGLGRLYAADWHCPGLALNNA